MALRMDITRVEIRNQVREIISEAERGPLLYSGQGTGDYARRFPKSSSAPLAAKLRAASRFNLADYSLRERVLFYTLLFASERTAIDLHPEAYAAFRSAYGIFRPHRSRRQLQEACKLPDLEHALSAMIVCCLSYQALRKDKPQDLKYFQESLGPRLEYEYFLAQETGAPADRDIEFFTTPSYRWDKFVDLRNLYRGLHP